MCVLHKSKSLSFKALGSVGGMSNLHSALFEAIDFERRSYANLKIPVCGSLALCSFSLYQRGTRTEILLTFEVMGNEIFLHVGLLFLSYVSYSYPQLLIDAWVLYYWLCSML